MAALKAMSPSLQRLPPAPSSSRQQNSFKPIESNDNGNSSFDESTVSSGSTNSGILPFQQELERASLLLKLEKMYNVLVDMERKTRTVDYNSSDGIYNNTTCKKGSTLPLTISNGLVLHVDKDMVRQWIENLLRSSNGRT
jgi:hypothetical protein